MAGGEQVDTAHHFGHTLRRVVDHHGEVIADPQVLAGDDDVAAGQWIGRHPPGLGIDPVEPPSLRQCGTDIEPPGKGLRRHVLGAFVL